MKASHEEEVTSLKLELEQAEEKLNKNLMEQRESYEKEIQNIRESIRANSPQIGSDDVEGMKSQIFELEAQNRSLEFTVKDFTAEVEKLQQNLRDKEKANSTALAEITSQLHEVETALELANSQISGFKVESESKDATIKALEKQVSTFNESAADQNVVDDLNAQINQNVSIINELNTKIVELEDVVNKQSQSLSEQEEAIAGLEEERNDDK